MTEALGIVQALIRADSHSGVPEMVDLCRAGAVDLILDVATSTRLRQHVVGLEAQVAARLKALPGRRRRMSDRSSVAIQVTIVKSAMPH